MRPAAITSREALTSLVVAGVLVLLAAAAALALLAAAAPVAQATTFAGVVPDVPTGAHVRPPVVPDVPTGAHVRPPPIARIANLAYGGGEVLHSNRTHLIFWQPSGSGLAFDPGYQSVIGTFMAGVAADSHKPTNVYGLSGQYTDSGGAAVYNSAYAGAVLATDPLPRNGCTEPVTAPAWSHCLSDLQLEAEIEHVVGVDRLPTSGRDVYFLLTPNGLGSCMYAGPNDCALGGVAGGYCGYHRTTPSPTILYAVIPYVAIAGHCQFGTPRPNLSTADPVISIISHEHNETITDPLGDAWSDGSGSEDGDLCMARYGPRLGGFGARVWNEVIHGGHYYLQEEWSNEDGSCQPRDESDPISLSAPRRARAGERVSFTGLARDPDGSIVAYRWFFGSGRQGHRRHVSHTFNRAGVYRVVLRATDQAGNWAFYARSIRVSKAAAGQG